MQAIGCVLLVACLGGDAPPATQPAPATSPAVKHASPRELTLAKWEAVVAVLRDPELDAAAKQDRIERIASPVLDFPLMAKLALGRTHWRRFTPSQRQRYEKLFAGRLKDSYRKRIAGYEGGEVRFRALPTDPEKDRPKGTQRVPIHLLTGEDTILILQKFRRLEQAWKIYDIEIEGVSILLTYRSQFNDILQDGTPEDLLAALEPEPAE